MGLTGEVHICRLVGTMCIGFGVVGFNSAESCAVSRVSGTGDVLCLQLESTCKEAQGIGVCG